VSRKIKLASAAAAVLAALALAVTGCGDASSPSEAPSTIYPESSPTGTLPALKAYLDDADQVLSQVATTVGALPDAVEGISKTPDDTWTASAAQLKSIGSQLGEESAALAALQPPAALQPVQDAVVKGIESARQGVDKLADGLDSGVRSAATRKAQVQSTVEKLQAQLDGLSSQLRGAIESLRGQ
jgi:uncharacterized phage infection (PIP) family protein YhgE